MCDNDPFPVFKSIEANVSFWKSVYSQYTTKQNIVHDNNRLDIVYDVVSLEVSSSRNARRRNSQKNRVALKKYKTILKKLSNSFPPSTPEELKVVNLWKKYYNGPKTYKTAVKNIRIQKGQRDRFINGVIRSGAFIEQIKSIFKQNGLPVDLAYIPHVESSFNYKAYSKFGASGIWQFTRSTGRRYMTINYEVDERRDPIRATYAATKYLKNSYQTLQDWPMSITSYNHGLNGMKRAWKKYHNYESIFNQYQGRLFKFASRNFYSEFLAAREVAKNYKKYFGDLVLASATHTKAIEMPGFASAKKITDYFGIPLGRLQDLNPALKSTVFEEQKFIPVGYLLRVPNEKKYLNKATEMPSELFTDHQKRLAFYRVQRRDTIISISKRLRVPKNHLILANNLDSRARIYAGQVLRVPTVEEAAILLAKYKTSRKQELQEVPIQEADKHLSQLAQVNPNIVSGNLQVDRIFSKNSIRYGVISIEAGETLGHYAHWLEIPTNQIRKINDLSFRQQIKTDHQLVIPLDKVSESKFEERRYEYHKEIEADFAEVFKIDSIQIYKIKRGDNIWMLCNSVFELPFWLIKKYNVKTDFNNLRPGQQLLVPVIKEDNTTEENS
ncbi:MAG: transglycosylase SLT domain-containing protein [Deltaproteobacteria bacterium]|nr:transglycosylase SLT domain-containing protein [Deltaproteobacteria bacterium]MBT4527262.1 transglycosylase SLT domain-containing protein [Deltaproteobacteria bacterium]